MKGILFDIQRFSLHDGPGIRTTVFMKGCPLRCIWCHNPESWQMKPQLIYKKENCTNCLCCIPACHSEAHKNLDNRHVFDSSLCKGYFSCVQACNYNALKIAGFEMEPETVMEEVEADNEYYHRSGGGLTVSGGEPMHQFAFLNELLELARRRNIHTCIQTCGYSEQENYRQILKFTDLFLFDIKATEMEKHKALTGVSNELIQKNLDFLYANGASIILRCPLVPGVNDTDQHIGRIAKLMEKYPALKGTEILPYHDMGRGKWEETGKEYALKELKSAGHEEKNLWREKFKRLGCDVTIS